VLRYPRIERRVSTTAGADLIADIRAHAVLIADREAIGIRSRDRDDDYLLGLAQSAAAILVTGDRDLLELTDVPVESPRSFLESLPRISEHPALYRVRASRGTPRGGRPRNGRSRRASRTASHLS